MAFADTSNAAIAIAKEVTYAVNPATGAVYARFTSDTLAHETESKSSEEVTGDRNPRGLIRTNISARGDLNFEFSDNNFDLLLGGALTSTFSSPLAVTNADVTISGASGGQFSLSSTSSPFTSVVVGQWIRLEGFATNGTIYCRVIAKADADNLTAQGTRDDGTAVTNEVAASGIDVDGEHMKLGTTKTFFTIEREWLDVNVFDLFTGMAVGAASLTITPGDFISGRFSFLGAKQQVFTSSQIGSITAAGGERVLNAVDNVDAVMEGVFTSESTFCFSEISFDIDNRLRAQNCIGTLGASGVGLGVAEITGTLKAFLEDETLLSKFVDYQASKLSFRLLDSDGNVMIFTFPQLKFATGTDFITGNAADGIVELTWTAEKENGISNSAITIDRFGPVAT